MVRIDQRHPEQLYEVKGFKQIMALKEEDAEKLNLEGLTIMLSKRLDELTDETDKKVDSYILKKVYDNAHATVIAKIDELPKVDAKLVVARVKALIENESQFAESTKKDLLAWTK